MTRNGQTVAYIRVSTEDQNTARQQELADRADRVFEEKMSGVDIAHRPQLQEALAYLREGDTLIVWAIDRLTRSLPDLDRIINDLRSRGISVEFVSEGMKFPAGEEIDPFTEAQLYTVGVFAQLVRRMNSVNAREGIAIAKREKRYKGRKPKLTRDDLERLRDRAATGVAKAKIAREFGINRDTLYRALRGEYKSAEEWAEEIKASRKAKKDASTKRQANRNETD